MNAFTDFYERGLKTDPTFVRRFYPRKIACPTSHYSPKSAAGFLIGAYLAAHIVPDPTDMQFFETSVAALLEEKFVPTFFVDQALLDEARRSSADTSITLADLHWPFDALLFMFPKEAVPGISGHVPFMAMCNRRQGAIYKNYSIKGLPADRPQLREMQNFTSMAAGNTNRDEILHFNWPSEDSIAPILQGDEVLPMPGSQPLSHDEDVLSRQLFSLGLKLILVATARPDLISEGVVLARKSKVRPLPPIDPDALYSPSWLRLPSTSMADSHSSGHAATNIAEFDRHSPRFHLRRGHFKKQPHGPAHSLRKIIWIRPTTVGEQFAKAA
jgi:hypothetical protein